MTPDEIAETTARILIETSAIQFNAAKPFMFKSGWASPTYCDCRKLISFPRARTKLVDMMVDTIERKIGFESLDAVAGGETAGIPIAAWVADRLHLPMLYVRKTAKGYGRNRQVEGDCRAGQRVLLVEDLATDGRSKIIFCDALREVGAKVTDTIVWFYYGIFPQAPGSLADHGVRLHALATWWDVLKVAERDKLFPDQIGEVRKFLESPADWSQAHGGVREPKPEAA